MARGPHITEEEKTKAKELRGTGLSYTAVAKEMKRSVGAIHKILKPPVDDTPSQSS